MTTGSWVKPTAAARALLPDAPEEPPYPGAKPLLVAPPDDPELLAALAERMTSELEVPGPKRRWADMKLFFRYLRDRYAALLVVALCLGICAVVFALLRLPVSAVGYAALLCGAVAAVWLTVGFLRYLARHRQLVKLQCEIALTLEHLPEPGTLRQMRTIRPFCARWTASAGRWRRISRPAIGT